MATASSERSVSTSARSRAASRSLLGGSTCSTARGWQPWQHGTALLGRDGRAEPGGAERIDAHAKLRHFYEILNLLNPHGLWWRAPLDIWGWPAGRAISCLADLPGFACTAPRDGAVKGSVTGRFGAFLPGTELALSSSFLCLRWRRRCGPLKGDGAEGVGDDDEAASSLDEPDEPPLPARPEHSAHSVVSGTLPPEDSPEDTPEEVDSLGPSGPSAPPSTLRREHLLEERTATEARVRARVSKTR